MSDAFANTASEIISRYNAGEREFDEIELTEDESFAGVTLSGAYFRKSWFHSVNFSSADLHNCTFEDSCLKCINFRGADLRDVRLKGVVLCGADLTGALVTGASAHDTTWYGAEVTDLTKLVRD